MIVLSAIGLVHAPGIAKSAQRDKRAARRAAPCAAQFWGEGLQELCSFLLGHQRFVSHASPFNMSCKDGSESGADVLTRERDAGVNPSASRYVFRIRAASSRARMDGLASCSGLGGHG